MSGKKKTDSCWPEWVADPADVYTLSLPDTGVTLDGEAFDREEPRAYQALPGSALTGALAEITYGTVLETYPGQLGEVTAVNIRSDGFDDRCALYLRVLDDLWDVDGGLNGDITMASVDLSQTSLSESEQAAVASGFRREARYFRPADAELCGTGGGGVSHRCGIGFRRHSLLGGGLPVCHYGAGGRKQRTERRRGHRDL